MAVNIGVNGVARVAKKLYIGVGGVAREVTKMYVGVGGVARKVWPIDFPVTHSDIIWQNTPNGSNGTIYNLGTLVTNVTTWSVAANSFNLGSITNGWKTTILPSSGLITFLTNNDLYFQVNITVSIPISSGASYFWIWKDIWKIDKNGAIILNSSDSTTSRPSTDYTVSLAASSGGYE